MSTPEGLDKTRPEQQHESPQTDDQPTKSMKSGDSKNEKKRSNEAAEVEREPGKTLLPFARVQKIIKADKDIPIVAREATFLIAVATEEFIKRLTEAGQQVAHREKRATVQHRDIATVVRRADEFLFLEDIMPWTSADPPAKRQKPVGKAPGGKGNDAAQTSLLDQFMVNRKDTEEDREDIVMNEDGTMYAGNAVEFEE
ncbi:histone-fold-containing protein [Gymnopilus junonius]|uniref:Histone-fold-containing protein n=1 Tax=Gymnopilus junonius TaxID=109634 RepID=A0A9P5NXU4_GYMJU|nr:histone-fold-containing protein [Gymnopilus junonius]